MDITKTDNTSEMQPQNHCKLIIDNIFKLLDGEMTNDEEQMFFTHVNKCPKCLEDFQIERAFKDYICQRMHKKTIDPSLVETIRLQIKSMDSTKALILLAFISRFFSL